MMKVDSCLISVLCCVCAWRFVIILQLWSRASAVQHVALNFRRKMQACTTTKFALPMSPGAYLRIDVRPRHVLVQATRREAGVKMISIGKLSIQGSIKSSLTPTSVCLVWQRARFNISLQAAALRNVTKRAPPTSALSNYSVAAAGLGLFGVAQAAIADEMGGCFDCVQLVRRLLIIPSSAASSACCCNLEYQINLSIAPCMFLSVDGVTSLQFVLIASLCQCRPGRSSVHTPVGIVALPVMRWSMTTHHASLLQISAPLSRKACAAIHMHSQLHSASSCTPFCKPPTHAYHVYSVKERYQYHPGQG